MDSTKKRNILIFEKTIKNIKNNKTKRWILQRNGTRFWKL